MPDYTAWGERELIAELRRRDDFRDDLIRIYDFLKETQEEDFRESGYPNGHIYKSVEELAELLELAD